MDGSAGGDAVGDQADGDGLGAAGRRVLQDVEVVAEAIVEILEVLEGQLGLDGLEAALTDAGNVGLVSGGDFAVRCACSDTAVDIVGFDQTAAVFLRLIVIAIGGTRTATGRGDEGQSKGEEEKAHS